MVVDTNKNNELAVVPLSSKSGNNRTELKGYAKNYKLKNGKIQKVKTFYKHFLEIEDDEGNLIVVNSKFHENHPNMDLTHKQIEEIRNMIFKLSKQKERNSKLFSKFKK